MRILLDSYAWIELFKGTIEGSRVKRLMEANAGEVYTTAANYYEVYYSMEEDFGGEIRAKCMASVKASSQMLSIDAKTAEEAAILRLRAGLSAVDAFTLAAGKALGAKVVTGDPHLTKFSQETINLRHPK